MAEKSILLAVGDPQALVDITQALGPCWEATSAPSEADAFAQLEMRSFNALLVDFNLGSPDGSELLNQTLEKRPEIIRFLLAHEADLALVAAKVRGSHRILPKPIELPSLKSRIENGVVPDDSNSNQNGNHQAGVCAPQTISPVYSELLKALESPGVTNEQVATLIAQDAALTAELLGLTHSAYLGLPRNVTDPVAAVGLLGFVTVKGLVMALQFLAEHNQLKPGYLSIDQLWQHSTNVARLARDLVLFETKDRTLASEALTAGLLHDLGKVVLVSNFDDLYGRVHSLARKQPVPLWEIEKEMFGANHGEVGGCLVGMWNMPNSIVEATAFHHEPPLSEHEHLTPLAAVHIANVLEHQLWPSDEFRVAPIINAAFLNELGLLQRLPVWRAAIPNREVANPELKVESADINQWESIPPAPSTPPPPRSTNRFSEPTATMSGPRSSWAGKPAVHASRHRQRGWAYAGVAAGLLILLALWLGTQPERNTPEPVYARTPAPNEAPVEISSTPPPGTAPAAAPELTPAMAVSEAAPATNVSSSAFPEPAGFKLQPDPTPAVPPHATGARIPPPNLTLKEKAPSDFRLSGVFYTSVHPSAIVNGQTVCVGDRVSGATVLAIGRNNVTLLINGQRKSFGLR